MFNPRAFCLFVALLITCLGHFSLRAQEYFPPIDGSEWQTVDPADLGWCTENISLLKNYLDSTETKAFIILHKGRIALEYYFNNHTAELPWYWASAGKTIIAVLTGIAQNEGLLNLEDKSSDYLGTGWTRMTQPQEEAITIRHHLTMTCGFETTGIDLNCTDPDCLIYRTEPGQRWFYHNAGYLLMHDILSASTGMEVQQFTQAKLLEKTGMSGRWIESGEYGHLFWSTARDMARFGLLMSRNGDWQGTPVLEDKAYLAEMTSTSQNLNLSYGYLWWLNGQASHILPGVGFSIRGPLAPDAPSDLFAGIGKNGQYVEVIPSLDLVVIRMGENPEISLVPTKYHNEMWKKINTVVCKTTEVSNQMPQPLRVYPNPCNNWVYAQLDIARPCAYQIFDIFGALVSEGITLNGTIDTGGLRPGHYVMMAEGRVGQIIKAE